jgi:hypothetical protein
MTVPSDKQKVKDFILSYKDDEAHAGTGITKLTSVTNTNSDTNRYHNGIISNEMFEGSLSKVYSNVDSPPLSTNVIIDTPSSVYIATRDGINKTAWNILTEQNRQWPPTDGTTSDIIEGQTSTWNITGASYGNGQYTATSSVGVLAGWTTYWAFDNRLDNASWHTQSGQTRGILTLESPTEFVLNYYILVHRDLDDPAYSPKDWTVEGSDNGTNWFLLDTQSDQILLDYTAERTYYIPSNAIAYKYHRLNVTANNGQDHLLVGEWKLFETAYD